MDEQSLSALKDVHVALEVCFQSMDEICSALSIILKDGQYPLFMKHPLLVSDRIVAYDAEHSQVVEVSTGVRPENSAA